MHEIPTGFRSPSAQRTSEVIRRGAAANLWHAFNFAADIGKPLDTLITLNFAHTDCPPELMTARFRALIDEKFGRWWREPPAPTGLGRQGASVYVWVAENSSEQHHIHWALHLPRKRRADFMARLPSWLAKFGIIVQSDRAIHFEEIDGPRGLRKYLLKGCDRAYAAFLKIDFRPQGLIVGKRSGVSRSLQRTARERANYRGGRLRAMGLRLARSVPQPRMGLNAPSQQPGDRAGDWGG